MAPRTTLAGRLVALLIGVLLTVVMAELASRVLFPDWREFNSERFVRTVSVPGHLDVATGRPGFDGYFAQNNGDFRVRVRINAFGLRNAEPVAAAGGRVWIIGDSLTFGWGVEGAEIYSSVVAERAGLGTYNIASPGGALCQYQSLRARMPANLKPAAVVVGLVFEGDVQDYDCPRDVAAAGASRGDEPAPSLDLMTVKTWFTKRSALYNFTAVAAKRIGGLVALFKALGLVAQEHAYQAYLDGSNQDRILETTVAELNRLRASFEPGTRFAVLFAAARFDVRDGDRLYTDARRGLGRLLNNAGIDVIDPTAALKRAGFSKVFFAHDGHWSAAGHAIAGAAVADWLMGRQRSDEEITK